jgi:hypothetical protein
VPQNALLTPRTFSLEAWVKPDLTGVNSTIVSKEASFTSSQSGYGFRQRSDNRFWFVLGRAGAGEVISLP